MASPRQQQQQQQQQQQAAAEEEEEYTSPEEMADHEVDGEFNSHVEELVDIVGDQLSEEEELEHEEAAGDEEAEPQHEGDMAIPFDPAALGLKEISNLGKFTVSSHKPGNGVDELRNDDTDAYWQSDGPQPHRLTVYFIKRVGIRDVRYYVDYVNDESYTPTKIVFKSGTSENNLIEFARADLVSPVGWQQVPIAGAGGGPDGNTLVSYVFQMQILENRQNGKDTHLRGIKIYAADSDARGGGGATGGAVAGAARAGTTASSHVPDQAETPIGISGTALAEMEDLIDNAADMRLRKQRRHRNEGHLRRLREQVAGATNEFDMDVGDGDDQLAGNTELRMRQAYRRRREQRRDADEPGMAEPDFMREPEIR